MAKYYIQDGDKCWIGGTCLRKDSSAPGEWIFEGTNDDMYYNGEIVNIDKNGYYIKKDEDTK